MAFSFNTLTTVQAQSTTKKQLDPWNIYDVTFTDVSKDEFSGKADPSQKYKVLKVRFDNKEGYHEESIFYIDPTNPDDTQRSTQQAFDGSEYPTPSRWEKTSIMMAQIAKVLNPEGWDKFTKFVNENGDKIKTFDQVVEAYIKILIPAKGKATKIKLTGYVNKKGQVVTNFPNECGINSTTGEAYPRTNFIGDNLFWSDREKTRKAKFENATPSPAPSDDVVNDTLGVDTPSEDNSGLDFDSLL